MKEKGMKFFREFKDFINKGSVLNLAVGIIIGGAFSKVVNSLVGDVIMPVLSPLMKMANFANLYIPMDGKTYESLAAAQEAGVGVLTYGAFITAIVDFLIMAFCIFLLVKAASKLERKPPAPAPAAPTTKKCPYCLNEVPIQATRCGHCTSELNEPAA